MNTSTPARYHRISIALHWLMLALIVAVYACIELRELYPKDSDPREALKTWHFMLGLSVLALVTVRIGTRLVLPAPPVTPALPLWQTVLAKLVHLALYALMLGLPIAGWLLLSAAGKPVPFFGLELPPLTGKNPELAKQIKGLHVQAGQAGYALIALHAAASLYHHYIRRDDTLTRMLPGR